MFSQEQFEQGVYRLMNTPLHQYPFPHFFVDSVFPTALYKEILSHFPSIEKMKTLKELDRGVYEKRYVFPLKGDTLKELESEELKFWTQAHKAFYSRTFFQCVMKRFSYFINMNTLKKIGVTGIFPRVDLIEDQEEYELTPHTDSETDLVTLLFYLPSNDKSAEWGTSIYVPKEKGEKAPSYKHLEKTSFFEVARLPYIPNSCFAFVRSDHSFHGVEKIIKKRGKVQRRLLIYTIRGQSASDKVHKD